MTAGNLQYVDVTLHVLAESISLQFLAFSWVGSVETLVRTTVESDCSELLRMYSLRFFLFVAGLSSDK
jgi:hypothetical protein